MAFNTKLLNEMLKQRRITQAELAKATGRNKRTIGRWTGGQYVPKEKDRLKIAGFLGCDPGVFDAETANEMGVAVHAKVSAASHNAFEILNLRFGVSQKQIIELAPVLFSLVAERALQVPLEDEERPERGKLPYYNQSSDHAEGFNFDKHAAQMGKCFGSSTKPRETASPRNLFDEAMRRICRDLVDPPNVALADEYPSAGIAPTAVGFNPFVDGVFAISEGDPELIEAVTQGRVRLAEILASHKKGAGDIVTLMRNELKKYRDESERKLKEWQADYGARHPSEAREYDVLVAEYCHPEGWFPEDYTAAQRAEAKAEPWREDRHLDNTKFPGFAAHRQLMTDDKMSMNSFLWEMREPVYQRFWQLRFHREKSKRVFDGAAK